MTAILCFGDSLTWGYDAAGAGRHALADRWPSVLQSELGGQVYVVADGLNGRTTAFDDNVASADRNGARLLPSVLVTHAPLDLVIIMLGSNDMKPWIHGNPWAARQGMQRLIEIVRGTAYPVEQAPPQILIVSPPHVTATADPEYTAMFDRGAEASRRIAPLYRSLAEETGCAFFDAAEVAVTTPLDGVHLDAESTRAIGRALAPMVRRILDI